MNEKVIPEDILKEYVRKGGVFGMFRGSDYVPEMDDARLTSQLERIHNLMQDGKWRTLGEIREATGDPEASISAQLRHLRKKRFGSHIIEKRSRGERSKGLFEYRLGKQNYPGEQIEAKNKHEVE